MAFIGNFNANDVEPADFSAIPSGNYPALITSSEFRTTKSGDGQYLVLAIQIIDGAKKGRMLWHNLNLINSNPKAVEIAQRELSAICRATGAMQIDNSEVLHNLPMKITVAFIPAGPDRKGVYREESNQIKKWAALTAPAASAAATPAPAAPRPATTAAPARPAAPPKAPPAPPAAVAGKPWGPKAHEPVPKAAGGIEDDIPF